MRHTWYIPFSTHHIWASFKIKIEIDHCNGLYVGMRQGNSRYSTVITSRRTKCKRKCSQILYTTVWFTLAKVILISHAKENNYITTGAECFFFTSVSDLIYSLMFYSAFKKTPIFWKTIPEILFKIKEVIIKVALLLFAA